MLNPINTVLIIVEYLHGGKKYCQCLHNKTFAELLDK